MPTATAFTALGKGNGFPLCPAKERVDTYEKWVTLGGVSSGSASEAQINTSLANAMKLFWNFYGITGDTSADATDFFSSSDPPASASITRESGNVDARFLGSPTGGPYTDTDPEPSKRVCLDIWRMDDADKDSADAYDIVVARSDYWSNIIKIYRMYNGETDDEDNFVGYGINAIGASVSTYLVDASVSLRSFTNETTGDVEPPPLDPVSAKQSVTEQTVSGIPFIAIAYGSSEWAGDVNDVTVDGLSASVQQSSADSCSVQIDSLDFYTY